MYHRILNTAIDPGRHSASDVCSESVGGEGSEAGVKSLSWNPSALGLKIFRVLCCGIGCSVCRYENEGRSHQSKYQLRLARQWKRNERV